MAGSISSLGIGSGTLTSDVLDKLKKADEKGRITPFETKIKANETQQSDIKTLKNLTNELKSISGLLSGEMGYLDVETSTNGSSATVTAEAGTRIQDFTLNVTQLAQKQISQSQGFSSETSALGQNGNLSFHIDGKDYTVEINDTMNLKDIKDAIFDKTDGKIVASSLNTGGSDPFSLVLRSSESGASNGFTITDSSNLFGFSDKQTAQDAKFEYDGVEITRSSNKVDDLIVGVSIQLNEAEERDVGNNITKSGKTSVSITQKTTDILGNVEKFVEKYNELITNLNTVTGYDAEKKTRGTFQGNSEVNDIKTQIRNSLMQTGGAMSDFGIEMQRNGELTLDKAKLQDQANKDFSKVKEFFQGTTKADGSVDKVGIFSSIDKTLKNITSSKDGLFKLVESDLKSKSKNLTKELTDAKQNLEDKYSIMAKRFASYDAMISKMNAGFSSLKMMIQQSVTAK